jgi:hypothetical protein
MKKLLVMAAATMAVLTVLVARPSTTSAHTICASHTYDVACLQNYHHTVVVCDNEKDSHAVEAWVKVSGGVLGPYRDLNGSKSPCTFYELPKPAYALAVCEETKGCSGYRYD